MIGGRMKGIFLVYRKISGLMNSIAGTVLFSMMILTVSDVILRSFGRPIVGTYELVSVGGAIVIGFAIPQATHDNAHVTMDFLMQNRSETVKRNVFLFTRLLAILLFVVLGYHLVLKGNHLYKSGDISMTLGLPAYLITHTLALCCFAEAFVLLGDGLVKLGIGESHE
jgi:TRAP-type C4-dicarboxylate transport system permease small subunit